MDLDALNRIADEAKRLDHERSNCQCVRQKAGIARNLTGTLVSLLMAPDSKLRRYPDQGDNRLLSYIEEIIEPLREDILAQIEQRMAAEEKQLFLRAAVKRQLIAASIVSKPADTDGGAQ